jgi:opacity protein-like surface antigen
MHSIFNMEAHTPYLPAVLSFAIITLLTIANAVAQTEDSSNAYSFLKTTVIGGYGNILYQHNSDLKTSTIDLERVVLFVGHDFGDISLFTELEMEDAKVTGGESGGEIAFEQAYLKFDLNNTHYIVAGLFLPRIGILNENHEPTDFNGAERPQVETLVIPATWGELGVGFYGSFDVLPLNYNIALVNGLNSASFQHGSGIIEGRFEGRKASANNIAITGALQYYLGNLKLQVSGYFGGTVGFASGQADSLHLVAGPFGTPVELGEGDLQYSTNGLSLKVLGTFILIPKAADINRAYANNTPELEYGTYAEAGYNILDDFPKSNGRKLIAFARVEKMDLNAKIPNNGIIDETLNQWHLVAGISYLPINNVVIKADLRFMHTGEQNSKLVINPFASPYKTNNVFLNIGIGYQF